MRYVIVVEKAGDGFSAYVPDLPVCIATVPTREAVEREIAEAIRFHVAGLLEDGQPVPTPTTQAQPTRRAGGRIDDDLFMTFHEWGNEADTADYADL